MYGENVKLCMTETDCFLVEFTAKVIYEDIYIEFIKR